MPQRTKPPFRADHVGSLLRPKKLLDTRDKWRQGKISDEILKTEENRHILDAINLQHEVGLKVITDGEFRRDYWHLDFIAGFEGVELNQETYGHAFSGGGTVATFKITGKFGNNVGFMREHFKYLQSNTNQIGKFCIPAPGMTYLRSGRAAINSAIYQNLSEFWDDVVAAYANEVREFYDIGCRYLQFDDVSFAYLCDKEFREGVIERGDDPDEMIETFAKAISRAIADRPDDMTVTTHMCRGNFQSTWMTQGGYEPVADIMFRNLNVDGYFMEYDSDRSGDFEPLRFVRNDQIIVLGLISSKVPELESKDEIMRRIEEATRYISIENICLSPQCGFSSTHHGNKLSMDDQKRKLELVVNITQDIWGDT